MAKKGTQKSKEKPKKQAYIAGAGIVVEQPITTTLEVNYMPYAMSVIVSRALPEIDGFKPSHRKLLYTMYKMGLLNGTRTKSANIVGQTMRLNPHGDQAIYETMVRLSKGNETLLHSYVDSKGNFGKAYSRDMAYAASRYTEAKLTDICNEFFGEIEKNTVEFVPNYDNTTKEPLLLPTTFPSVLVNSNVGIAVAMASSICSFNLKEVCEATIGLIKDPDFDVSQVILGPDFAGGGQLFFDKDELDKAINTGRASFKIRSRYNYDKADNCIEITQIPATTTVEAIIDKIVDLVKLGKIKEISDIRDETDLNGLKITLDLKRGVDSEKLMQRLFKMTTLQDTYSCNFNILIAGSPRVMGVREIIIEWLDFRRSCVKRSLEYDLQKKQDKLHLLKGLEKIVLDIDKAVKIVRETEEEKEVVPNLMIGFGITEIQAEYVAEIKLRHLNAEYILKRTKEIEQLIEDINSLQETLGNPKRINKLIVTELKRVIDKYAQPRKTILVHFDDVIHEDYEEEIADHPVNLILTKEGYFKKITPQSLRMNSEQKLKESDEVVSHIETGNNTELLFFTDKAQVYKTNASEFDDMKSSIMGDFIPARLKFDPDEKIVCMITTTDYKGHLLFFYDNGKVAKVPLSVYETKTKRKKLSNAYCDKFTLIYAERILESKEFAMTSTSKRCVIIDSAMINEKTTKTTQGIQIMTLKKNHSICNVCSVEDSGLLNLHRFRVKNIPVIGAIIKPDDEGEQISMLQ